MRSCGTGCFFRRGITEEPASPTRPAGKARWGTASTLRKLSSTTGRWVARAEVVRERTGFHDEIEFIGFFLCCSASYRIESDPSAICSMNWEKCCVTSVPVTDWSLLGECPFTHSFISVPVLLWRELLWIVCPAEGSHPFPFSAPCRKTQSHDTRDTETQQCSDWFYHLAGFLYTDRKCQWNSRISAC